MAIASRISCSRDIAVVRAYRQFRDRAAWRRRLQEEMRERLIQ
jgi:hypothetical protein